MIPGQPGKGTLQPVRRATDDGAGSRVPAAAMTAATVTPVGRPQRVEWPTVLLLIGVYSGFGAVTIWAQDLPVWVWVPALAVLIVQQSSLQHEVLHGHPFPSRFWSEATVFLPIGLAIPYQRFRETHLQHHFDPALTDPYDDPESNFQDPEVWSRLDPLAQRILTWNNTLLGRMILGPVIGLGQFYTADARLLRAGDHSVVHAWTMHIAGMAVLLGWLAAASSASVGGYLVAAYLALAILRIRTFLEHRAHDRAAARSVIVEARCPLALLFLNNNFHAVHHAHPKVAWYRLPSLYRARRSDFLRRNGGYMYESYGAVFRQFFVNAKDPVAHPLMPGTSPVSAGDSPKIGQHAENQS